MKAADRERVLEAYVLARLREEESRHKGRGYRAELSRRVGMSSAHISNVMNLKAEMGPDFIKAICEHWGLKRGELEAEAFGETLPAKAPVPRAVREMVEDQAVKRSLSSGVVEAALWACASAGTASLDADGADALLDLAIGFDRGIRLVLAGR